MMSQLRAEAKIRFGEYLKLLASTKEFDQSLNSKKTKLSPFKVEQFNESHAIQSLNILCYEFS